MPSPTDHDLNQSIEQLASLLRARGQTLATAESCTGGWIAKLCTDWAGSSAWFASGIVSYSNAAKQQYLGVPAAVLATQGVVSEPVALAMARGVVGAFGADYGVAVTGIAGPEGGTPEQPVGTVWLAWATPERAEAACYVWSGSRDDVRRQAVAAALTGLLQRLG